MTLTEFRKTYPQYNDVPDLELADKLHDKYYQDIDKNEYYKSLFPDIAQVKIARGENLNFADDNQFMSPDDQFQYVLMKVQVQKHDLLHHLDLTKRTKLLQLKMYYQIYTNKT